MKGAAATAGMLSAAILLARGCERRPQPRNSKGKPARRGAYSRSLDTLAWRIAEYRP
jgi:hypothetical protein